MTLKESNVYRMREEARYANGDLIVKSIDYRERCDLCIKRELRSRQEVACECTAKAPTNHVQSRGDVERLKVPLLKGSPRFTGMPRA